jgi:hypothetical protein
MSDFEALLNKEIVESGAVPPPQVLSRTLELGGLLEIYFADRNILTPALTDNSNTITYFDKSEDSGFSVSISFDRPTQTVVEQLSMWSPELRVVIKGRLTSKDFEYIFSR